MAKKTYDYCFVFESAPPKEWTEAFEGVYWVPMIEFTKRSHMEHLDPSIKILWHAKSGFDAACDMIKDADRQIYMPYVVDPRPMAKQAKDPCSVIVHQRARCFDVDTFMDTLLTKSARAKVVLWNHVGQRNALDHWSGPRVRLEKGWLSSQAWSDMTAQAGTYVAGRAMEGIGLCVQEAAANGCIIAGPRQSVSAEYVGSPEGSILVDLHERPREDWLGQRYGWGRNEGGKEEATIELAERVAQVIDSASHEDILSRGRAAAKEIEAAKEVFESRFKRLLEEMRPRRIVQIPKTRRRLLSIQTTAWGGQGLFELWMVKHLSRHPHHSVFTSRLWVQKNDSEEQTEHARLMEGQDIRMVAPQIEDLESVDADFVIFHWSGGCEALCDPRQMDEVERYLSTTKASVMVFLHNIQPGSLPDWLKESADMFVVPSNHAAEAYRDVLGGVPLVVLPHFLDPELASMPTKPVRKAIVLGALGRVQWSKFDPIYYRGISTFLKEGRGRECMWIGSSADGYLEGDEFTKDTIGPDIHAVFGPGRADFLDKITIGLFLSPVEESFCLAALEMASRGIPVVTNRSEIKSLLGGAAVMAASPESVLETLRNLVRDGSAYGRMMRCGRALRDDGQYSFEKWEERFFSLLSKCSSTHGFHDWTVIIPCRDVGAYLEECLDSVMANNPSQVIVVLDGCTDNTAEVVDKMRERHGVNRIECLVNNNPPHSQAKAWKIAFPKARHNLIALVDGDDKLATHALETMGKAHVQNPGAGLVWSSQCVVDHQGSRIEASFSNHPGKDETILEAMEQGMNVVSHLITFKAWLIPFLDFPDDLEASADKHLALQLEEKAPWAFVDEELYVYRWRRPGSITDKRHDTQEASKARILKMARDRRS
jgi:hypothetical protein